MREMLSNPLVVQSNNDWPKSRKLIFAICLIAFVLQLYKITAHYYRYETIFQTKQIYESKEILDLPAVTLCTDPDLLYLKSRLRKKYPSIDKELERIENKSISTKEKESEKNGIYRRYIKGQDSVSKHYFDNAIKDTDFAQCLLDTTTLLMDKANWNLRSTTDCSAFSPVLESKNSPFGKCFTYFSRQQSQIKDMTDLQIDLKKTTGFSFLNMLVLMDLFDDVVKEEEFFDYFPTKQSVFMFIHDSYQMPSFEVLDAIELIPGKYYDIRFWSTTKSLLKPPFHSNCNDYHKNFKSKDLPKSRDQCIHDCYLEKSALYLNCLIPTRILMNDDKQKGNDLNFCRNYNDLTLGRKLYKQCRDSCRPDCSKTEYQFDYKTRDGHNVQKKYSLVHLDYRRGHDSEYKERPVQTMCDTIQKMFITLLIWFGLSVFSFSTVFETVVKRATPQMYYIMEGKVTPNVVPVIQQNNDLLPKLDSNNAHTDQGMIKPKFTPTNIGSNVKLEHYNEFISKVVDGYPTAHTVDLSMKKSLPQY